MAHFQLAVSGDLLPATDGYKVPTHVLYVDTEPAPPPALRASQEA